MENQFLGLKTAIEESEKYLRDQINSVETFKSHQSRILTSVSLIISVTGLLLGQNQKSLVISPVILVILGTLFCIILIDYAFVILPISLDTPIRIDRTVFNKAFIGKPEEKILNNKLKNYIIVINNNRRKITRLIWASRVSVVSFLFILIGIFHIINKLL